VNSKKAKYFVIVTKNAEGVSNSNFITNFMSSNLLLYADFLYYQSILLLEILTCVAKNRTVE